MQQTIARIKIIYCFLTIRDRVGLDDTFEEGDAFVYRPLGDGRFEFVSRIGLYDWPTLASLNAER